MVTMVTMGKILSSNQKKKLGAMKKIMPLVGGVVFLVFVSLSKQFTSAPPQESDNFESPLCPCKKKYFSNTSHEFNLLLELNFLFYTIFLLT